MSELGTAIDPAKLVPGVLPVSQTADDGSIGGEVLWVDRFGNLQLNVDPAELEGWGDTVDVLGGRTDRTATRVTTFAAVPPGGLGLLVDSAGLIAVVVDRSSAAFELELGEGDAVTLRPSAGAGGVVTQVRIGRSTTPAGPGPSFDNEEIACDPPR
jgi:S-adenosylmethionine hydrolase